MVPFSAAIPLWSHKMPGAYDAHPVFQSNPALRDYWPAFTCADGMTGKYE
jgi:hypothetical protein